MDLLNGERRTEDVSLILVAEFRGEDIAPSQNTIWLRFDDRSCGLRWLSADGDASATGEVSFQELFDGMRLGRKPRELLARAGLDLRAELERYVPLFVVASNGSSMEYHSQIRFSDRDAVFIRSHSRPRAAALVSRGTCWPAWLDEAVELHALDPVFMNNHQCYYRKCFAGKEIEEKISLPDDADIWSLNLEVYERLRAGELPGFVPEYGDEFQQWDYLNYLFEIRQPESERGYISFIPRTDGRFTIKRKIFEEDRLVRTELHYPGIEVTRPFQEEIRERFGVEPVALPPFRRVRYDVNLECVQTGHVHGIFFDRATIVGTPAARLSQCEIEYLRSRVRADPDEDAVFPEVEALASWTLGFLQKRGVRAARTYESKLSFLKRHVAERALAGGRA